MVCCQNNGFVLGTLNTIGLFIGKPEKHNLDSRPRRNSGLGFCNASLEDVLCVAGKDLGLCLLCLHHVCHAVLSLPSRGTRFYLGTVVAFVCPIVQRSILLVRNLFIGVFDLQLKDPQKDLLHIRPRCRAVTVSQLRDCPEETGIANADFWPRNQLDILKLSTYLYLMRIVENDGDHC